MNVTQFHTHAFVNKSRYWDSNLCMLILEMHFSVLFIYFFLLYILVKIIKKCFIKYEELFGL